MKLSERLASAGLSLFALLALFALTATGCQSTSPGGDASPIPDASGDAPMTATDAAFDARGATDAASTDAHAAPGDAGDGGALKRADGAVDAGNTDAMPSAGDAGHTDATAETGVSVATACAAWAGAICGQLASCSSFGLSATYGDSPTCEARMTLSCTASLAAPGTGATPSATAACASALPSTSCSDFLSGNLPGACATASGTVAAGGACGFDAQCPAGNFCAIAPNTVCGTCQPKTTVGGGCANGACSSQMYCDTLATPAACVAQNSVASGGACDVQQQCDLASATGCSANGGNAGTCDVTLSVAASGGACGVTNALGPDVSVCPASGFCSAQGLTTGSCSAAAADSASCVTGGTGAGCMAPAACVSGTCTLPNAAACK